MIKRKNTRFKTNATKWFNYVTNYVMNTKFILIGSYVGFNKKIPQHQIYNWMYICLTFALLAIYFEIIYPINVF